MMRSAQTSRLSTELVWETLSARSLVPPSGCWEVGRSPRLLATDRDHGALLNSDNLSVPVNEDALFRQLAAQVLAAPAPETTPDLATENAGLRARIAQLESQLEEGLTVPQTIHFVYPPGKPARVSPPTGQRRWRPHFASAPAEREDEGV